jgi:hypothetical protein
MSIAAIAACEAIALRKFLVAAPATIMDFISDEA